jgi:hypothetical protein
MNVIQPFRNSLNLLIKATWADVSAPVFRMTQIQRRNWVNEIQNKKLTPPYCVVEIPPPYSEPGWSASAPTWKVSPVIYYIAAEKDGAGDIGALIEQRLSDLSDVLQFRFGFTVPDSPTIDSSASEAVNDSMLQAEMPYLSGALSFGALIGFVK